VGRKGGLGTGGELGTFSINREMTGGELTPGEGRGEDEASWKCKFSKNKKGGKVKRIRL